MTVREVALVGLGLSVGFGAAVWIMMGWTLWPTHRWRAFWNFNVAAADLGGLVILSARLIDRPLDLPMGVVTLLLLPIVVIPPALRLRDWFTAKALADRERIRADE